MSDRDPEVGRMLLPYYERINGTPALISLLYDADMLPEQTTTRRGAIAIAAVVEAYEAGQKAAAPALLNAVEIILDAANDRLADGLGHELPPTVRATLEAAVAKVKGDGSCRAAIALTTEGAE